MQSLDEKKYNLMIFSKIEPLILKMSIPTVIAMLVTVIYNTADTYFVSQINASASAAVGAVYSVMAIIQAVGFGLGMGASSLISRCLGKKDREKADVYASSAFVCAIFLGILVCVFGLMFNKNILAMLGCSETMFPYAIAYSTFIFAAAPFSCSTFVLNNVVRAEGDATISMLGMGVGGLLNMALDPILIFLCNMGVAGAALATAISQLVSFLIFAFLFVKNKTIVHISIKKISGSVDDYVQIILTGLPTIFRQGLGSVASAMLNIQAVVYGDITVSAVTIANKVYVLVRNIIIGIGQGFQPVAGYNYAAGEKKRAWYAFVFTSLLGTAVCVAAAVLIGIFNTEIMAWFSKDAPVVPIGAEMLTICAFALPLMAFSTYINQIYQCLGFKLQATVLASCRQGIFFIPAILILPAFFGRIGVEAAQPVADIMTFVISVPFIIRFYKKRIL